MAIPTSAQTSNLILLIGILFPCHGAKERLEKDNVQLKSLILKIQIVTGMTSREASTEETLPDFLKYGRSKLEIYFENINAIVKRVGSWPILH